MGPIMTPNMISGLISIISLIIWTIISDGREKFVIFFGVLEWVRDSLGRCKMVQNSAVKWFWSLKWASGDEKWGLENGNFYKKVKMVMK